jgi:hypothetical protein
MRKELTDYTPGTWWRAPEDERRVAYYLCMRQCYGMPANEALAYVNQHYSEVGKVIEDVRAAIAIARAEGGS